MGKSNYFTSLGKGPLKAFQQIQSGGDTVHFDPAMTNMSKMTKMTKQTSGHNRTANNTELNTSYNFGSKILVDQQVPLERLEKRESEMSKYKSRSQLSKAKQSAEDTAGSASSSSQDERMTPMDLRKPFVVYHDDKDAHVQIREKRQRLQAMKDGRDSAMYDTNLSAIIKEVRTIQNSARNRDDCYSLMQDERSRNPFMRNIGKSSDFSPSRGVTHVDRPGDAASPRVSGGVYKHPNANIISRKEFEQRKSLSHLR